MNPKIVLSPVVTAFLLLIGALVLIWRFYPLTQASAGPTSLALKAPPFVSVAKAADTAVASPISDEAGISAYFQSSSAIDLNTVRSTFRTIETETANYIIGSVGVPNYDETQDVHAYVQTNGWVLVYYLKVDPVGKIFDWKDYDKSGPTVIPTKLENALALLASKVGAPFTTGTFYDFRYPNATQLTFIVKHHNSFQIKVPGTYAYYERSWASTYNFYLDDNHINPGDVYYGTLTPAQLAPDVFHEVKLDGADGVLMLVYRLP